MTAPAHGSASGEITRASVGLRSERGPVLLAVMLSMCLVAIDTTILATAVPTVVADLGGFSQFPWLFSVYLLAQAVTVPIYAKLADLYGRKPVMLVGIGIFVGSSLLCGLAWGMTSLIVFRALQGIGAGAVQPIGQTIIGDIYSVPERAKVQGYLASVWAVSAVLGPTIGGLFTDFLSWRLVFLVNLPIGIAAAVMFWSGFSETVERKRHRIDYSGAVLLSVGVLLLLLGLLEGGVRWAWTSGPSIALFVGAAVLLTAFAFVERRAAEPVLPGWVFRHRVVVAAMTTTMFVGVLMLGLTTYIPVYGQSVLGHGAVASGLALAAVAVGWPVAAANSGRFYLTIGFRSTMLIGGGVAAVGAALLLLVDPDGSIVMLAAPGFVMGLGFGLVASPAIIAAQSAVSWEQRGVATGSTTFSRSIGSAIGVAAFGAIVNGVVISHLGSGVPDLTRLTPDVLDAAIHAVFVACAVASLGLLGVGLLMPRQVTPPPAG